MRSVRHEDPSDHGGRRPGASVRRIGPFERGQEADGREDRRARSGPRARSRRSWPRCTVCSRALTEGEWTEGRGPRLVRRGPARAAVQRGGRPRPERRRGDRRRPGSTSWPSAALPHAILSRPSAPVVGGTPRRRLRADHGRARAVHVPHRSGRGDRGRRHGRPGAGSSSTWSTRPTRGGCARRAGAGRRLRGARGAPRPAHGGGAARAPRGCARTSAGPTASRARWVWEPWPTATWACSTSRPRPRSGDAASGTPSPPGSWPTGCGRAPTRRTCSRAHGVRRVRADGLPHRRDLGLLLPGR